MAYIQRDLPQPIRPTPFSLNDFSGGLNNVASDSLLADNEASDILNMKFESNGTIQKRNGFSKYSPNQYNGAVKFLDVFITKDDGKKLMVCTNDKLYADGVEITTVAQPISGVTYLNNYFFVDGVNYRVYGKFPQASIGSNLTIIGTPINTYTVMTIVNPPVGFTPLPNPNTVGCWKYDYTNKKIWYEPCAQELADTFKGANLLPTKPTIIICSGDRLYMNGDAVNVGNVFISDIQNSFYMPVGMPIQMPPNGEEINGMVAFMNSVVIGRKSDVNVIYGNTNRTSLSDLFLRKQINTHAGFMNNNCINIVHDFLFYLGSDGIVYRMNTTQTNVEITSTKVLSSKINLFAQPINLTLSKMREMSSMFHDDNYYIIHKDIILIYSYRYQSWTIYKSLPYNCSVVINDVAVFGGEDGYLYKPSDTYDDDGIPILSYWSSKRYDFGLPSNYKQFKELFVVAHVFSDYVSDLNIRYEIDYVDVFQTSEISNQISKWNVATWGDRFLTRNISPSLPINIGRRGLNIRVIIMNGTKLRDIVDNHTALINYLHPVANDLFKVKDTGKFYKYNLGEYTELDSKYVFQPLKVYEINGEFRLKGKR